MAEFIRMYHPVLDAIATAPKKAFESVYKEKGWQELTEDGNVVPEHSEPVLDDLMGPEEDAAQSIEE
jgi:hypothetical protein